MTRRWAGLVAVLVALLVSVLVSAPAARADDGGTGAGTGAQRVPVMVATMNAGHPYVEAQAAGGDAALWTGRLQRALDAARFPAPLLVAVWTADEALPPQPTYLQGRDTTLADAGLRDGVYLFVESSGTVMDTHGLPADDARRVYELQKQAYAVVAEATRLTGADAGDEAPLGVATLWAWLRLVAPDAPTPTELARELSTAPGVFVDTRSFTSVSVADTGDQFEPLAPRTLAVIGLILGAYLLLRARGAWGRRGRGRGRTPVDVRAERLLMPAEVEREVTDLGVRISRADARPGDLLYDRAQACLDAAEAYVDRDAERDRVGVELLCGDGRAWLERRRPTPRCYFNPRHDAVTQVGTQVGHDDVSVPCCVACADAVRAGRAPDALLVRAEPGSSPRPYFETPDVWTTTGYGALSEDWAEQVHRDALEQR